MKPYRETEDNHQTWEEYTMSEETKNTAELTDKQLEKVAGGEGIGEKHLLS